MGNVLGYSTGYGTTNDPQPQGAVVSPTDAAVSRGPTFIAVPTPPPATQPPAPVLHPGVQADMQQRRDLARKFAEDIHYKLFGKKGIKPGSSGLSLSEIEYRIFAGETQGPQLRKEFLGMLTNDTNRPEMRFGKVKLGLNDEHNLSETPDNELSNYPDRVKGPAAYLRYRWRKEWEVNTVYLILKLDREQPLVYVREVASAAAAAK